ncbi:MAG: hypothetical protein FJX76_03050 [Armatimonadetes bacterium]|nr:hypothetical protein [Armatimonadota bacterium]
MLVSPDALARRYAEREFDYTFPRELLEFMTNGRLFAWKSGAEGEHTVIINQMDSGNRGSVEAAIASGQLFVEGNRLLVCPYSEFSLFADSQGHVTLCEGLAYEVAVPSGSYDI